MWEETQDKIKCLRIWKSLILHPALSSIHFQALPAALLIDYDSHVHQVRPPVSSISNFPAPRDHSPEAPLPLPPSWRAPGRSQPISEEPEDITSAIWPPQCICHCTSRGGARGQSTH